MRRITVLAIALVAASIGWATSGAGARARSNWRCGSNLNTLDPAKTKIGEEYIVNFLVFSGLTEIGRDGRVKPDLAERWTVSDDSRPGRSICARASSSITAASSTRRTSSPRSRASGQGDGLGDARQLRADRQDGGARHPYRALHAEGPYAGFADIFSDRQARIVPRDKLDTLAPQPIGTGPFKFKSFTPGDASRW